VSPRNPLNIGAAARAMANFGFRRLSIVAPFAVNWMEAKSAVGAPELLRDAVVFETLAEAVRSCTLVLGTGSLDRRKPEQAILGLPEAAERARAVVADGTAGTDRATSGRVALVFGSEKHGLTSDDLSWCHAVVVIDTCEAQPSMNLGQAVAVCLYEFIREEPLAWEERAARKSARFDPVSGSDAEQMTTMLLDVLRESGYMNRITAVSTEQKIRRWVRRLRIGQRDAALLLGILRQILWKFRN